MITGFCLAGIFFQAHTQSRAAFPSSKGLPGFAVSHWGYYPNTASPTPGHTVHNLFVVFDNDSPLEVSSVDVQAILLHDGKAVATQGPVRIDRFTDHSFMNRHGSVPGMKAFGDLVFTFDLPIGAWQPSWGAEFTILSLKTVGDKPDLHDLGHLYTWLRTAKDAEIASAVEHDPTLRAVTNEAGYSALSIAYMVGSRKAVEVLAGPTTFGAVTFPHGMSAMHVAAYNPHGGVLDFALARGGRPNDSSQSDQTPLMIASFTNNPLAVRWLLRHGADPNTVSKSGRTALDFAMLNSTEAVGLLVQGKANLGGHDARGYGPMQLTMSMSRFVPSIAASLRRGGLSVDDVDRKHGVTPLMAAAKAQHFDAVEWLVLRRAKLEAKDASSHDVYDYAREGSPDRSDAGLRRAIAEARRKLAKSKT